MKISMQALQISSRGGDLACAMDGNDRAVLAGHVVDYLVGEINFWIHRHATSEG